MWKEHGDSPLNAENVGAGLVEDDFTDRVLKEGSDEESEGRRVRLEIFRDF